MDREKQQKWEDQISDWRQSGLKQAEYCRRHNLKWHQFYYHKRRQEIRTDGSAEIVNSSKVKGSGEFIPFQFTPKWQVPADNDKLEIILHNGIRLIVPEGVRPKTLVDLVSLLKAV